ncbi:MAG: hypothetical protein VX464_20905 [Pseudomonadota bacterium]|nr:hypothetical protein [Pseudomonadota bacterium]
MTVARHAVITPPGFSPRLLRAEVAAAYCGVGRSYFEREVGKAFPAPILIGTTKLWDVRDLDKAIDALKSGDNDRPRLEVFQP